ncbi:MAG: DMT family transporter [Candidatus Berkelbacteria bacterium]|nr:DMT family transporter [Candidatus Berkelbacteria bacterium]
MKKLSKIIIFTILAVFLASFFGFSNTKADLPGPAGDPDARPSDCHTLIPLVTQTANESTVLRCATFSPAGYTVNLWYGDKDKTTGNEAFNFAGTADWGVAGTGDIGDYVYRSTKRPEFYIAVARKDQLGVVQAIYVTHHYKVGENLRWDENSADDRMYSVYKVGDDTPNLPDYRNAFDNGKRFVWRIVVNGKITLNNEIVKGAIVKLKVDNSAGPALDQVTSNDEGVFEFSYVGTNEDIWINQGTVSKIFLYVQTEKDNKYQIYKEIAFPQGFVPHGDQDTKMANLGTINLTTENKVDNFTEEAGGEQSTTEEAIGADSESQCEKEACRGTGGWLSIKGVFCKLGCAIVGLIGDFVNFAMKLLNEASGLTQNFFGVEHAYAKPLSEQLKAQQVVNGWKFALTFTDILIVLALMVLAFANILKISIDTYAIKKSLFPLIIGVILANLSLLICQVIVDFSSLLSDYFIKIGGSWSATGGGPMAGYGPGNLGDKIASLMGISPAATGGVAIATILGAIITAAIVPQAGCIVAIAAVVFLALPGLLILALAFLMYARVYVVWILTIMAPLAFICLGIPPLQQYFKQWWSWFTKWVFLAPIAYFFISLAAVLGSVTWASSDNKLSIFGGWLLGMVVLGMAIMIPFKMGGPIMAAWAAWGKKGGKLIGGLADIGISKVTKGWSPYGVYTGVKQAYEAGWKRHTTEVTGKGRALGETMTALPRTGWHRARQKLMGLKTSGSLRGVAKEQMKSRESINAGQEVDRILQETQIPYGGTELNNFLQSAIQNNDIGMAAPAMARAAEEGTLTDENFRGFAATFKGDLKAQATINKVENLSVQSGNGPSISPVKIENGQPEPLSDDEVKDKNRLLQKSMFGKNTAQQQQLINNMIGRINSDITTRSPGKDITSANFLQDLTPGEKQIMRFLHQIYQHEGNKSVLLKSVLNRIQPHMDRLNQPTP